jgi:hypothetical protein
MLSMKRNTSLELDELRAELWGSFLLFTQTFFPLVTGREFLISKPIGRESHFITIARELTSVARGRLSSLLINVAPGSGKSVILSMWVAWTLSRYPDSQYLYISYSHELAAKHTEFIRRIIQCPHYKELFGVTIRHDSKAKDFFQTTTGGSIKAFGSAGGITGQDAGMPNCDRFTGAVVMDDMHKPDEAHSDTIRQRVIDNYKETILQRPRGPNVPIISIGQCLHEADLPAFMKSGNDERVYKAVVLKSIDDAGNAMYPEVHPLSMLLEKKEKSPYVFASQFQQDPIPAGGALFKRDNFVLLDEEPDMLVTFLVGDTAETSKSYNDATAFAFLGLYKIVEAGQETGQLGLHIIDCIELRIEPKDLEAEFKSFYAECMLHPVKPRIAAIEKKSTGVTLCSVLQSMRGLEIREVKRTRASGCKADRYLEMQPIIASKLVSLTANAKHTELVINHMLKITANDSHRHDDVCHAKGSKIATIFGDKNVEDIVTGDKVITPFGIGVVSASGMTGYHKVIKKIGLNSTPDHQVFTSKGFLPLDSICDDDKIDSLSFIGLMKWKLKSRLFLMGKNIHAESREDIIEVAQEIQKTKLFIEPFMSFIAEKKYQKAMTFIILTAIDLITIIKIWSYYRGANMLKGILNKLKTCETMQNFGIKAKKAEPGIVNRQLKILRSGVQYVSSAIKNSIMNAPSPKFRPAVQNAIPLNIEEISETLQPNASFAALNSPRKNSTLSPEIEKHARINAEETVEPVYAITIEKYGVYYCNGILLRNCDVIYDGVKIGLIDKTLYIADTNTQRTETARSLNQDFLARTRALQNRNRAGF